MCGRFNIQDDPLTRALMDALGVPAALPNAVNIAPTEAVPVVFEEDGARRMRLMRWWLTPHWAPEVTSRYAMFNARSETVESSRAFRGPLRYRRCVIPASSFIEWSTHNGHKQAWLIREHQAALAFAGVWDVWERGGNYLESCTILTTAASEQFRAYHTRMPVMLRRPDLDRWLDVSVPPIELRDIYPAPTDVTLEVAPLRKTIGNSRDKNPDLVLPESDFRSLEVP